MRFYYLSLFSWMAYGLYLFLVLGALWALWSKVFKLKLRNPVYWVLVAAVVIGPWAEELWIAYNFDRLCRKDAGVFVNKTVEVDGFYDDSRGASLELVRSGTYRFIESRGNGGYTRLTLGDGSLMQQGLERFQKGNPGRDPFAQDVIRVNVDERTEALVFPKRGDVWRITKIDKPTARYQYTARQSAPVGYKIRKTEHRVEDRQTGELLGRETVYARDAYWFFIHLDAPVMLCPAAGERPGDPKGMLYENVLIAKSAK